MGPPSLTPVFLGSLARRRAASLLSMLAIALGVALGLAVQLINDAALDEFGRGMRVLAGEADLQVRGPASGFDDALFERLALRPEVAAASPLVDIAARDADTGEALRILGADALRLPGLQPRLLPRPVAGAGRFALFEQDALFLSPGLQARLGRGPGDEIRVRGADGLVAMRIAGGVPALAGEPLAVMDIHAAQTRFGLRGRLTGIDLRLAEGLSPDAGRRVLQALVPPGVVVATPGDSVEQAGGLSRAYRVNLTMLAVIALVTGGFLVFATQALSITRRQAEFAFLRALGLSRRRLMGWLLIEGMVLGLLGSALGCGLGYGFAAAALGWLGGDLGAGYFEGLRPGLRVELQPSAIFLLLGTLAGMAGAWVPARAAARVAPAAALKAGGTLPGSGQAGHPRAALACLVAAVLVSGLPPCGGIPVAGYLAIALLLAGGVLALGGLCRWMARHVPSRGIACTLAGARLRRMPGEAVVAGGGVLASAALAVAMAVMVASFRESVDQWLLRVLPAELYVRATERGHGGRLDPTLQQGLLAMPGVASIDFLRHDRLWLEGGGSAVAMIARPVSPDGRELPLVGPSGEFDAPVWISEALADLRGLAIGAPLEVPLAGRSHRFRVAGVWRDYARQSGALVLPLERYRALTGDLDADDAAIRLDGSLSADALAAEVRRRFAGHVLDIVSPGEIRRLSLRIFDRTFAVTYLLEAAAVGIGLAGIAASFAAMAAARRREFGMLRHLGLGRRQIGATIAIEGALTAAAGALGGAMLGGAIALVLVEVVNRQSFHWSMDYQVPLLSIVVFLGALVGLASLAAVLAGRQAMAGSAVRAVSEDW